MLYLFVVLSRYGNQYFRSQDKCAWTKMGERGEEKEKRKRRKKKKTSTTNNNKRNPPDGDSAIRGLINSELKSQQILKIMACSNSGRRAVTSFIYNGCRVCASCINYTCHDAFPRAGERKKKN